MGSNNIAQGLAPVVGWASTHYMPLTGAHKKQRHHHLFAPYRGVFLFMGIRLDRVKALSYDILPFDFPFGRRAKPSGHTSVIPDTGCVTQRTTGGQDGVKRSKHANGKKLKGKVVQQMPDA